MDSSIPLSLHLRNPFQHNYCFQHFPHLGMMLIRWLSCNQSPYREKEVVEIQYDDISKKCFQNNGGEPQISCVSFLYISSIANHLIALIEAYQNS